MPMTTPLAALLLAACTGSSPAPQADDVEVAQANPDTPELSADDLAKDAENIALVPSPVETQKALEAAGIETKLGTLVQADRAFEIEGKDHDNVAIRTGVVLADMMLTLKTSEKDAKVAQLTRLHQGMGVLGGGDDIARTLTEYRDRVKADAITSEELLKEMDELSGAVIPELEFNGRTRIVPLIQAGTWLEGANLVARAVKASGEPSAADDLLKQPAVVSYFLGYVRDEGRDKAPPAVTEQLESSLKTLEALARKAEPLTMDDIDTVIETTDDVLALL